MADLSKKSVTEQLEQLQLEETQERIEKSRADKKARENRNRSMQASIERSAAIRRAIQDGCWHKKGGKGVSMLYRGNDANYAVIKHQLGHGPIIIVCQRCSKIWEAPDKPAKGASAEEKEKYKADLIEYTRALNLPTDNEQSGTQLFVVTKNEPAA